MRSNRLLGPWLCACLSAGLSLGALNCAGPPAAAPSSGFPAYSAEAAALFDDTLSHAVFAMPERDDPAAGQRFAARTREADLVTSARIGTVSREGTGEFTRYSLSFTPIGAPLKGSVEGPIEVMVGPTNPTFSLVSGQDTMLVGKEVLLFLKRFDERGELTHHFRAEPNSPQVIDRVRRELALAELASES